MIPIHKAGQIEMVLSDFLTVTDGTKKEAIRDETFVKAIGEIVDIYNKEGSLFLSNFIAKFIKFKDEEAYLDPKDTKEILEFIKDRITDKVNYVEEMKK